MKEGIRDAYVKICMTNYGLDPKDKDLHKVKPMIIQERYIVELRLNKRSRTKLV